VRAPTVASAAANAGLGSGMREEVWAIVRAGVEEAMGQLVTRQRELEARVERAERFADAAKGAARPVGAGIPTAAPQAASSSTAASRRGSLGTISSIPVAMSPSVSPPAFTPPPAPPVPRAEALAASAAVPDPKNAAPPAAHPPASRSLRPTNTYGVTVMPSTRPSIDLDSVGAVDIAGFDGGRSKRRVTTAVVVIMLLIVASVVTMTLASRS
jgi:hypothetical protein